MTPVFTAEQLLEDLAAILKKPAASDLPAYWAGIVGVARTAGSQEVQGRLLKRGFTTAQVAAWDRRGEYERDISMYFALIRGGAFGQLDQETRDALDRREELDEALVFVGGVYVSPDEKKGPGTVGFGKPSNDGAIFNWPGQSGNTGSDTRW